MRHTLDCSLQRLLILLCQTLILAMATFGCVEGRAGGRDRFSERACVHGGAPACWHSCSDNHRLLPSLWANRCRYSLPLSYHLPTQLVCVLIISIHTPQRCAMELRAVQGAAEFYQLAAERTSRVVHACRYSLAPMFWVSRDPSACGGEVGCVREGTTL